MAEPEVMELEPVPFDADPAWSVFFTRSTRGWYVLWQRDFSGRPRLRGQWPPERLESAIGTARWLKGTFW